jgi:2-polyprenyl-3-methyl-5-hydroxy-6-metoxy-1,4-benzoquinol methylase
MSRRESQILHKFFREFVDPDATILDVGCGLGRNLDFLQKIGYKNVLGLDVNHDSLSACKARGHFVAHIDEDLDGRKFDVLLFSHVIEHIPYPEIVAFFHKYFQSAKPNALVIIACPTFWQGFFNDVDHARPYFPHGLKVLFDPNGQYSRQYRSKFKLELLAVRFVKEPAYPYHLESMYAKRLAGKLKYRIIRSCFEALFWLSCGVLSKTVGYVGVFRLANA